MATAHTVQREGKKAFDQATKGLEQANREAASGFDQLATGLRSALKDAEGFVSSADLSVVTDFLKPITNAASRAWNTTVRYSKQHPYRVGFTVVALGLIGYRLMQPKRAAIRS